MKLSLQYILLHPIEFRLVPVLKTNARLLMARPALGHKRQRYSSKNQTLLPQFCKGHRFWALSNLSRKFASCIVSFFQRLVRTKDRGMLMISQVPRLAHCYAKFLSSLDIEIDYLTRPQKSSWATNYSPTHLLLEVGWGTWLVHDELDDESTLIFLLKVVVIMT